MICDLNCSNCPYAAKEAAERRSVVVDVVGAVPQNPLLDFSTAPVRFIAHRDRSIRLINFTGTYRRIGRKIMDSRPDIVLNILDATDLENGLELTSRLIDMDSHVVLAITRYDELLATGHDLDYKTLGKFFGFPAITLDGSEESLSRLLSLILDTCDTPFVLKKHVHVPYGADVDKAIEKVTAVVAQSPSLGEIYHDRYLAVRMLEDKDYILPRIQEDPMADRILETVAKEARKLEKAYGEPAHDLVKKAREGFIAGALQETVRHSDDNSDHTVTQKIDAILTNKWLGLPLLILVLFGVFEATFALGAYPQQWIENGITLLCTALSGAMRPGWLSSLLIDGIVQGVGAVLAFLPNIIILFFFLSLLEDSGYMARAAFVMDKIMHRIGLHGRSFIPMLLGFGCNVPAIMAARSIEDRRDRALTMLMIPFMSCSARLPVYLLFIGAFFARYKALVLLGIYVSGILLSIIFAFVMKRTKYFSKEEEDYVSELPAFRKPTWRSTGAHIWERVADYLKKISTVILAASVIIWALEYFPSDRTHGGADKEESCLAMIGRSISPVMEPLGFDWKMNVCLLTGLPAKEAIVSTMGILYHTEDEESLYEAIKTEGGMTPAAALAFMLFVLLYFPCVATISTLRREIGRKWALFTVINSLLLAWIVAFAVFRIGSLLP